MLILSATTDKIQVITSAAAAIDVHASYADLSAGAVSPNRQNTAITTATTTDVVAAPAASTQRNVKTLHIRNKDAVNPSDVTVQFNQNATLFELFKATLRPGDVLEYIEGIGFFVITGSVGPLRNYSTANQAFSTADLYLLGSNISIPGNFPIVGAKYTCTFDMAKTAGTGQIVVSVRYGTTGSTADTARCTFTFGAGTGVADTGVFVVTCVFRTVGSGTTAVLEGNISLVKNLTITGLTNVSGAIQSTSGGFDSTVANSIIGVSFNGQTAFAGTAQLVRAELVA